jgi:Sec7-like guanine-nucleotide exchange factor
MTLAVATFNKKPKKGVELLISCGTVEQSPSSIAAFLFNNKLLKKSAVGEYLGEQ